MPFPVIEVVEGDDVVVSCEPSPLELLVNGILVDANFDGLNGVRRFQLGPANRSDDGNTFQCIQGDIVSDITTLTVFCKILIKVYIAVFIS